MLRFAFLLHGIFASLFPAFVDHEISPEIVSLIQIEAPRIPPFDWVKECGHLWELSSGRTIFSGT
jgi:hypothetical protein